MVRLHRMVLVTLLSMELRGASTFLLQFDHFVELTLFFYLSFRRTYDCTEEIIARLSGIKLRQNKITTPKLSPPAVSAGSFQTSVVSQPASKPASKSSKCVCEPETLLGAMDEELERKL